MDRIRAFIEADIPQVVRLHETMVEPEASVRAGQSPSNGYFTRVFLDNPSRDEALPSLVYETTTDRSSGSSAWRLAGCR